MKKMRKLIPAFAMLLVSAIMMSTASFAWFTMNEEVTATGMQVQAQAAGSLIIDDQPLTFESGEIEVEFATGVEKLLPIHLKDDGHWMLPNNPQLVHPQTGMPTTGDNLREETFATVSTAKYFFDKTVYIGSAGDAQSGTLTIKLTAPIAYDSDATLAYAVAIYVMDSLTAVPATNAKPNAIIHVDEAEENGQKRNEATIANFTAPSIVGVGDQNENTTGTKIVLRFFVDGDLQSLVQKPFADGREWKSATGSSYVTTKSYYVKEQITDAEGTKDVYKPAVIPEGMASGATITAEWFTSEVKYTDSYYKYVNSGDVPTAASSLEVSFTLQ